jgi:hypothetical protein
MVMTHLPEKLRIKTNATILENPTCMGESEMKKYGNRGLDGDRSCRRKPK